MQLTKGAIGNLINRYRAVLKKCHLLNVFGSLAVAGMLVMGGADAAEAKYALDGAAYDVTVISDTELSFAPSGVAAGETRGSDDIIGGNWQKEGTDSTIASTSITLKGNGEHSYNGELIGGSLIQGAGSTATVTGDTHISIEAGAKIGGVSYGKYNNVIGGGKTNGAGTSLVLGTAHVTVAGEVDGTVIGGGNAKKAITSTENVRAETAATDVHITDDAIVRGVVGGGVSDVYGAGTSAGSAITQVGDASISIAGGTIKKVIVPSSTVELNASVIGGGIASGEGATSSVGTAVVNIAGGTFEGNIHAGGAAVNGGTATVENTVLNIIDGKDAISSLPVAYAGGLDSGVSGTLAINIKGVNIDSPNKKISLYGGSKAASANTILHDGKVEMRVSDSTICADVRGGGGAFGDGAAVYTEESLVHVANTAVNGYEQGSNTWTGRIFGAGVAEGLNTSITHGSSTVIVENVSGVAYDLNTDTVSSNPGTRVYGGGQAYASNTTKAHPQVTVGSTQVVIKGQETALDAVLGGSIVSGTSNPDNCGLVVTGQTDVRIEAGTISTYVVGGNNSNWFGRSVIGNQNDSGAYEFNGVHYDVGSTRVSVTGGDLSSATVMGGSLSDYAWYYKENGVRESVVFGSTDVSISGGKIGTVVGGGLARYYNEQAANGVTDGKPSSTVQGRTHVQISGGETGDVIGGGLAVSNQSDLGAIATVTGESLVEVSGGIITGDVIGGGLAQGEADATLDGTANIVISNGAIKGNVYAGGYADGDGLGSACAAVDQANMTISGGTIEGTVYAGGAALGGGTATVKKFDVRITGGTITGNVVAGNYTGEEATNTSLMARPVPFNSGSSTGSITIGGDANIGGAVTVNDVTANVIIDGTDATVTDGYQGNAGSTLTFQNYNDKFDNVATGFGTLAVAENSTVTMDALVSGQRGSDDPKGFFGSPTPEGSTSENHQLTITGGGTIIADEFHVDPDASVTIESGNVVADEAHVKSAQLTVGKGTASASFTVNNALTFQEKGSISVENLGTATLGKEVVLNDEGKIDTTILTADNLQVNTGGTLKLEGLAGKTLTKDDLTALKNTTSGGLLDLGAADLGDVAQPDTDGNVNYGNVQGITSDSLKNETVAVDATQNTNGISGGFQAVKLTENDKELNAKNTLVLAGSQNGGNLVMQDDGSIANLRVGGPTSDQATSVVTLGLADANNTGAVNTVTMNAGSGKNATLNVIGAGTAEFTTGDIRANSSTNTINVQGATLNTGNITTEEKTAALDAMNITNGTVKAAGDAKIENVTLDNGLLQAVATTGETPAGGNITIATSLSGQGSVVADKTLMLATAYTGKEGDDLTLQADTLSTGAIDSITGDLAIAATNLVTSGETKLVDDTLVADNVALGDALTASGTSLVQVGGFYTDANTFTTEGLNKAVSVTGQSLMAYGADLAQAQQAVAETGHTGAAYYAGKTLTLGTGGSLTVGDTSGSTVAFGGDSLLVVDGTAMNGQTVFNGAEDASNLSATVDAGAKLHVDNAIAGNFTVFGDDFTTPTGSWANENVTTDSAMLDASYNVTDNKVTVGVNDAHTVFPNLSHELATAVNTLYDGKLNSVDSADMGVRFLSRATNDHYLGADKQAAASTIESAARMAFAGAVPQMTKMASDAGTNAVVNRLGFANPADGAQAMNAEGKIVDRNTTGFALWIAPLWQNQHGWGMEAGNLDYGFNGNLGGVSLGADYTFENAIRAGITFNIGGGYAESSGGDLNSTENRMTFWGLGAYAGWNYQNFGLMADVSYTSTWNDLEQDMDGRMGMGDLEADVQATAISAGLRAEYKLETSVLDIIPHIGVRYMSLNTWGYDVDTNGGTVLEGDGFHQDIWTFPIGVTFSKDFTLDSGWFFKPSVDFSVIPAAGDIKAKQDVAFTGLPGTYEVETQMMDYLTWQGGVGVQMGNDNLSFGVNYTLQAGQNTTGHGVFGSFRYEF